MKTEAVEIYQSITKGRNGLNEMCYDVKVTGSKDVSRFGLFESGFITDSVSLHKSEKAAIRSAKKFAKLHGLKFIA